MFRLYYAYGYPVLTALGGIASRFGAAQKGMLVGMRWDRFVALERPVMGHQTLRINEETYFRKIERLLGLTEVYGVHVLTLSRGTLSRPFSKRNSNN